MKLATVFSNAALVLIGIFLYANIAHGELNTQDARTITDSEEEFSRRIFSYDMDIDSNGDVHIIYSKPTTGDMADIVYVRRISGTWSEQTLSSLGQRQSISTQLIVDNNDLVHVSYIKDSPRNLYYRTINNGTPGSELEVDSGGWHTRMQLDGSPNAIFIRENETWPGLVSKLAILKTTNGTSWTKSFLDIPDAPKFRIGKFIFENGTYHVTYGDNSVMKLVLTGKGSTTYVNGIFHNLHYATSTDGLNWTSSVVDNSETLYENEFWTTLMVDSGTPFVAMYKYAEYNDEYNTGTSALLAKWDGAAWQKNNITVSTYPETREGMGISLTVKAPGEYFGVWDFSPDDTHDAFFRGERGNIALYRNGTDDDWGYRLQISPFSAEGEIKTILRHNNLYFLALGDFVDAKLYYREYDIDYINEQFDLLAREFPWEIFLPALVSNPTIP